jgi:uncharacterized membrane protein YphA (DoxX/SURF4 family)
VPTSSPARDPRAVDDEALLRRGVAMVWLATGLGVFHPYYRAIGNGYLRPLGLPALVMVATCAVEIGLSLALWLRPTDLRQALAQTAPVIAFTLILGFEQPLLLVHPFGVLSKNLPLLGAVWAAYLLQREGWTPRAERTLRVSMAIVWLTEGLFPKLLYVSPLETQVVMALGVSAATAVTLIHVAGALQMLSGLGVLLLRGRPLTWLLGALLAGLVLLPLLVTRSHPSMWVHPFGPLTKNFPILAGSFVLLRRARAASTSNAETR